MAQSSEFMNYILDRTTEDTEHGQVKRKYNEEVIYD